MLLKENSFPRADRMAALPSDNGMAPKIEQTDVIILEPLRNKQKIVNNSIYVIKNQANSFISIL